MDVWGGDTEWMVWMKTPLSFWARACVCRNHTF